MAARPFYKQWQFWLTLTSVTIALASLLITISGHRAKARAETARAATADSLGQMRLALDAERSRERDNLALFVHEYGTRLTAMSQALSRYQETHSSDARHDLDVSVQAMLRLVARARALSQRLNSRLDGHIDALERALALHDVAGIADAIALLGATADADLAALQDAIRELATEQASH